jgi:uncharacterized membrane protein YidH (DUF202 family)
MIDTMRSSSTDTNGSDRDQLAAARTSLADDRTLLAWYRTAFGADALAIGVGRVVPQLAGSTGVSYTVFGVLFAVLGASAPLGGAREYLFTLERQRGAQSAGRHFIVMFGLLSTFLSLGLAVLLALSS